MDDNEWLGVYAGYDWKSFDFKYGVDGKSEIHFKRGNERGSTREFLDIKYLLEEKIGRKWVRRQISKEGFTYADEAGLVEEKVSVTATYTGNTQVEITHEFEEEELSIRARIAGKETENEIRFSVSISVPHLWRNDAGEKLSERELKKKLEGAFVEAVRAKDGKKLKLGMWLETDLTDPENFGEGASEVLLDIKRFSRRKTLISVENPDHGALIPSNRGEHFYSGLKLTWLPDLQSLEKSDCVLKLSVK